ncbi:MAG: iron ABC transporter permease, partial [Alphaproteobacteria bacterium]|nr:iron ABC transporter permease [Alphaproteobacteria bacterium]
MTRPSRLTLVLAGLIAAAAVMGILLGETVFTMAQMSQAFADPASGPAEVLWQVRAPRVATALMVGAALGLSGAAMQGLLRNPLADPGVLGVSSSAAFAAAAAIVLGAAAVPGAVEISALIGAGLAGG